MKRVIIFVLLLLLPIFVSAKEMCELVSGNAKEIGSEIACGDEHFYVVDSTDDEIKMLAKYNLNVGTRIDKIKIEKEANDSRTDQQYCYDLAFIKGGKIRSDSFYNAPGYCFVETPLDKEYEAWEMPIEYAHTQTALTMCTEHVESLIASTGKQYHYSYNDTTSDNKLWCSYYIEKDYVSQDESALSAHWDENDNFIYPQVGDVYVTGKFESASSQNDETIIFDFRWDPDSSDKYDGYFYDLNFDNGPIPNTLNRYKEFLISKGYEINKIDLLTLDDVNNIVKKANKTIPYADWYNRTSTIAPPHFEFGNLKELLPKGYAFIYGTTYWLRTGYEPSRNSLNYMGVENVIFIDTNGGACSSGIDISSTNLPNCGILLSVNSQIGTGLRPIVSIPFEDIIYLIRTKTDGNGTIEVVKSARGNDTIDFKAIPNEGYRLKSIMIKADSGEEVEFSEEEIEKNEDGVLSVSKNKFTMPFENVTIIANWEKETIIDNIVEKVDEIVNPETRDAILLVLVVMFSGLAIYIVLKRKKISSV